jgi:ArsR family transcriptional regulator
VARSLQQFKAELFRALSHEVRIRVLEELRNGELSVGDLQERLKVSGPNLSQHLAILRTQNVLTTRREGTTVIYSITDRRIENLLDDARAIFEEQLAVSSALLDD